MNLIKLQRELDKSDITAACYSINGRANETYCLERAGTEWVVFYYERGIESGKRSFSSEREACEHFLKIILKDPNTRK